MTGMHSAASTVGPISRKSKYNLDFGVFFFSNSAYLAHLHGSTFLSDLLLQWKCWNVGLHLNEYIDVGGWNHGIIQAAQILQDH